MKHPSHLTDNFSKDFAVYIHWPFCQSKCPYCDFNSHVAKTIDYDQWERSYLLEIDRLARETSDRTVTSVFFGGGTPSLMPAKLVDSILSKIRFRWSMANSVEITLEANPGSVDFQRFEGFREAGVNRISLGIQAMNDTALKLLGRRHSAKDALIAIETAQRLFERVSIDLIYARQHQSLEDWEKELGLALGLGTDHLSLYQLTIEEGTAFHQRQLNGKLPGLPEDDLSTDMYCRTIEICQTFGLKNYEVSNFASKGAESRHNLTYWRTADYLGIGPGAHGRITSDKVRFATECHQNPSAWLNAVLETGCGESERTKLTHLDQLSEALIMGLRLEEGVMIGRLEALGFSTKSHPGLERLLASGLITLDKYRLKTTHQGRLLLNVVLRDLL